MQLLRDLVEERESWARKRDEEERELSRRSELIRRTLLTFGLPVGDFVTA